ncbi:MAG: pilus assembly protein CpaA [Alphaproteobacteria bacterium]|nr:pilus assembly protein CpaA [Alphaproteobacteria bacterium]
MSGLATLQISLLAGFSGLMVWCGIGDVRSRTISHTTIACVIVLFAAYALAGYADWQSGLISAMVLLIVGFILFHLKIMGGGDSKLIAAVGLWTGLSQLGAFLFYTAVAGGFVALAVLVAYRLRPQGPDSVAETAPSVPYGVAIALGGTIAAWRAALEGLI